MKKKNGFTTVELLVSFGLISVIVLFLFQIIFVVKNIFIDSGIKSKLLSKQAIMVEKIQKDFNDKTLIVANSCGVSCAEFIFDDGEVKKLSYNRDNNEIVYGDYKDHLIDGSKFGNIKMNSTLLAKTSNKKDGILVLKIPVISRFFDNEDFGINIVYQFDSSVTSVSNLNLEDKIATPYDIFLIGSNRDFKFVDNDYIDPGYYLYDLDTNQTVSNSPDVLVTGTVGNKVGETYDIIYNYKNEDLGINIKTTRSITVIDNSYDFKFINRPEEFTVPVDGTYKFEVWGASGGGSTSMKGMGGYTSGEKHLYKGDKLLVYVGGVGVHAIDDNPAPGGFNGGGESGPGYKNQASSGGGATDIRLNSDHLNSRVIVAGGGGGGGSRMDSTCKCNGGAGGGEEGLSGVCSAVSYLGKGGTSEYGGRAGYYDTNMSIKPTDGQLGVGGNGGVYSSSFTSRHCAGGGGGGYYGGGGGSRYAGGGGGSGYCAMTNCTLKNGTENFTSPITNTTVTGNNGNGYARITLISINN